MRTRIKDQSKAKWFWALAVAAAVAWDASRCFYQLSSWPILVCFLYSLSCRLMKPRAGECKPEFPQAATRNSWRRWRKCSTKAVTKLDNFWIYWSFKMSWICWILLNDVRFQDFACSHFESIRRCYSRGFQKAQGGFVLETLGAASGFACAVLHYTVLGLRAETVSYCSKLSLTVSYCGLLCLAVQAADKAKRILEDQRFQVARRQPWTWDQHITLWNKGIWVHTSI